MIDYLYGVSLNRIESTDLVTLQKWRNNFDIRKWCRQHDLIHENSQKAWFDKQSSDPTISMYKIEISGNRSVGVCGLTDINLIHRRAEFSLYVGKEHQGQGYGKAALITLLKHGFYSYNLNIIWGETFQGNPAIPLFESLGMKREGMRRDFYFKNGEYTDAFLYSVNRKQFESAIAGIPTLTPPPNAAGSSEHN